MLLFPPKTQNRNEETISGSFAVDAAGAVSDIIGDGFTPVYDSVAGSWTVTLHQSVSKFFSVIPGFTAAAATDSQALASTPVVATRSFHLYLWDINAGGVGALANKAGRMHFTAKVSRSL